MPLRALYESARLGMFMRGFRPGAVDVQTAASDRITYLDGRHLARPEGKDAPTTIFVHGLGSSVATWSPILAPAARAVPVVAPDLPGYGRTPLHDGKAFATFSEKVEAVHGFLDAISPDEPVQLVGQSMGGWIAARVAAERPHRVGRLTLVNTAGLLHAQVFEQRRLFTPEDRAALRRLWQSMWKRLPIAYYLFEREYLRLTRTPLVQGFLGSVGEEDFLNDDLGRITAPTLVVWGLDDRLISHESVLILRDGLPDVRIREIPHCGHVPQRECSRAFLHYVLPWLRGNEPPEVIVPGLRAARAPGAPRRNR